MTVLLQASGLAHWAGETTLFQDLELTLRQGERLALAGHNGSGKTTLLDLLSGAAAPDVGEVRRRRGLRVARVEQFLPPELVTVGLLDAVAMCGPASERWRAEMLLAGFRFGQDSLGQPVGTLSGGQQNRLMFARALEAEKTFVSDGSPLSLDLALGDSRARQVVAVERFDVTVAYRRLFTVQELIVRPGQRLALLGHNGVGKSTFIRALVAAAGEPPTDGRIRFSPQTVLGYYDEELEEVSGAETLMDFAVRRTGRDEQTVCNRLIHAGFAFPTHGNRVGSLSGGERARLLFLVLSLNAPNFLIMDEPTNHLDIDGKEELETQLLASQAALLITSHDRRFLTTVADRFLWIHGGRLMELEDPEEFFLSEPDGEGGASRPAERQPAAELLPAVAAGAEDEILSRIVELEQLLEADRARKPRHQKPDRQTAWQRELEMLYDRLS